MTEGAIFDMDGTLLDSTFIWERIAEEYLLSLGIEPRENLSETFKTFTLEQAAAYLKENYSIAFSVGEIMCDVNDMVKKYYEETLSLKCGAADFLDRLQKIGVKMCVATLSDVKLAEAALSRLGVRNYFSAIVTCAETGVGKTDPYIYREALKILGTKKDTTVVFEDSLYALKTAKKDGFLTAGVFDPHEKDQAEMKAIADYYIYDFSNFSL